MRADRLRGVVARWRHAGYAETGTLGPGPRLVLAHHGRDEGHRPGLSRRPVPRSAGWRTSAPCWPSGSGSRAGEVYQDGRAWWRSERRIRAALGGRVGTAHLPDAEVHWPSLDASPYAGQVWAIEAELTPKPLARTVTIMRGLLARTSDYGPGATHRARAALRAGGLPDRPGRPARGDPGGRRAARAASAPDRGPRPAPKGRVVSIWSWLRLTAALWLIRKGFKAFGWLLVAAVAVAAWPLTIVAAIGYLAAWLRGWPPARLWHAAALGAAHDRRLRHRRGAPAAGLAGRGAGPGQ